MEQFKPYVYLELDKNNPIYRLYVCAQIPEGWKYLGLNIDDTDRNAIHYDNKYTEPAHVRNVTLEIEEDATIQVATDICLKYDGLPKTGGHLLVDVHIADVNNPKDEKNLKGKTVVAYEHADDDSSGA